MMYILLGHQDSIGSISETLSTFNNIISQASKFLSLQKKKKLMLSSMIFFVVNIKARLYNFHCQVQILKTYMKIF